jgi:hypothetical protein
MFNTTGPTKMVVGEAGPETVAVLRNPREMGVGGGGLTINGGIHIHVDGAALAGGNLREQARAMARDMVAAIRELQLAIPNLTLLPGT